MALSAICLAGSRRSATVEPCPLQAWAAVSVRAYSIASRSGCRPDAAVQQAVRTFDESQLSQLIEEAMRLIQSAVLESEVDQGLGHRSRREMFEEHRKPAHGVKTDVSDDLPNCLTMTRGNGPHDVEDESVDLGRGITCDWHRCDLSSRRPSPDQSPERAVRQGSLRCWLASTRSMFAGNAPSSDQK